MSILVRKGSIIAIAILACAAGGFASARAETPMPAPAATPSMQLALTQSEIAWCRNSAARIQSQQSRYRSDCSGSLSQVQYARCQEIGRAINRAIAIHNARCR